MKRFIIVVIGLVFLGIICLYKNKMVEGMKTNEIDPSDQSISEEDAKKLTKQMKAAGIPLNVSSNSTIQNMFSTLTSILTDETAAQNERNDASHQAVDTAGGESPAVNAYEPICNDKTFFTGTKFGDAFCKIYTNNIELNSKCATLTSDNCNATDCCIWVNGAKCVAGNVNGPIMIDGKTIDTDYYSYKYQCYGDCSQVEDPCSDNTLTRIPIDCMNKFLNKANCAEAVIPPNTASTISIPGFPEYNILINNGIIDISHIPNMDWGIFQDIWLETIKSNPGICAVGSGGIVNNTRGGVAASNAGCPCANTDDKSLAMNSTRIKRSGVSISRRD